MISAKKFHKTIISVVVLSEEPYVLNDLATVAHDIVEGDCVGSYTVASAQILDGKEMAVELRHTRSDPAFFQLTEDGEDLEP